MDKPGDKSKSQNKPLTASNKPSRALESKEGSSRKPDATIIKKAARPAPVDQKRPSGLNDKTVVKKPLENNGDATVIKRPSRQPEIAADGDKTRIAMPQQKKSINRAVRSDRRPAPDVGDRTVIQSPKQNPNQSPNQNPNQNPKSDRTQIAAPPPEESRDKTAFNPGARGLASGGAKTKITKPEPGLALEPGQAKKASSSGVPTLKNRFIFEEMLGAGGMGMVYKAKDLLKVEAQDRDPFVAIKVLGDDFKSHPEAFIALQRESRKTQRIAHPNIVNVYDFDKDGDDVFMTMEFLDGKPLDKLISQYKATGLAQDDAWRILEGISAALIYAHAENIIHSDFKPGNIFVTKKGLAKVFDFGIARAVAAAESHEDDPEDKTVFDAGNLGALTPAYASKEMLEGKEPDVRDDIYALGCIAYEMFTGRHPFDRVHANEAARLGLKAERIPELNKTQWKALEKALAFERNDRVASVDEFWSMMTQKRQSYVRAVLVSILILGLVSSLGYLLYFQEPAAPTISEDEVRSEIELQLRIEQHKNEITSLLKTLEFSRSWEADLLLAFNALTELVTEQDPWVQTQTGEVYTRYLEKIGAWIEEEALADAARLLENAPRYAGDIDALATLQEQYDQTLQTIEKRILEEKERQRLAQRKSVQVAEQRAEQKRVRDIFDQAMTNVQEQVSCRSGLNMPDLKIAVTKLREVDLSRYRSNESDIVTALSGCIEQIGRTFPERATEYKKQSISLFPKNSVISSISVIPKDPCDLSLAGLGARGKRASCRDRLAGEERGPAMVVIPSKGSIQAFAIGKYELSQEEYNQYCSSSGNCTPSDSGNLDFPVTNISSTEAKRYLRWISEKAKRTYRLPTRAEWEYAAKAQSGSLDSNRNCKLNSRGIQKGGSILKADVGAQNKWGLVNHVGNVRELVTSRGGKITAMGGSYLTSMEDCTTSLSESISRADEFTGFRVLREIVERK